MSEEKPFAAERAQLYAPGRRYPSCEEVGRALGIDRKTVKRIADRVGIRLYDVRGAGRGKLRVQPAAFDAIVASITGTGTSGTSGTSGQNPASTATTSR